MRPDELQPDQPIGELAHLRHAWPRLGRTTTWLAVAAATGALALLAGYFLPPAVDWRYVLRPGALSLLAGQSPYAAVERQSAAPWALLALIPLAVLPETLGRGLLFVISLGAFAYAAVRLGAKRFSLAFLLLSPPVLHGLLNGNIDWIVFWGVCFRPRLESF